MINNPYDIAQRVIQGQEIPDQRRALMLVSVELIRLSEKLNELIRKLEAND